MDTKVLTAHVPIPVADKVDAMAARLDQSSDWVVEQAVTAWVARHEGRYQATLDALQDVENGVLHDHAFIESWADCLGAKQQ